MDAIVIDNVVKYFRKRTIRGEVTTFKSELVQWLRGGRRRQPVRYIEALRGIDLRIPAGKTVGILGRNGSGKSTLLKLITGIYAPTSGTISVKGRISALLDLGAGFHPDFSGRENILINGIILGMTRAEVKARMDEIIAFSELGDFIDEPVRTYSSGMYMRLAFSVATHVDPDILIIDEILAVGDEHFSKKSFAKMNEFKRAGKTIVLVTHDLATVERWCDLAAWIDGGKIRRVGPPAELAHEYREAIALAEAQSMSFVPAGLSETGGALPSVQPQAATLLQVRLEGAGADGAFDTAGPLEVRVEVPAGMPDGTRLELGVYSPDGRDWTVSRRTLEELGARAGAVVRWRVERLGLAPGVYEVRARLVPTDGAARSERLLVFGVKGPETQDSGLLRPVLHWRAEPAEEALAQLPVAGAR